MKFDRTVRYWNLADVKASLGLPVGPEDNRLVRARVVRELSGNISDMTLWRRIRAEQVPAPVTRQSASEK